MSIAHNSNSLEIRNSFDVKTQCAISIVPIVLHYKLKMLFAVFISLMSYQTALSKSFTRTLAIFKLHQ